ncbi:uncharacterized protein [Physcomitrium patens]|uniref:Uncharacterized protein n=1 Tax=Physcomitrium patens TaxID=3218 RepID=A0A2K1IM42_PHYPA|nr:protein PLASTID TRANSCRIPTIONALLY ACTIVE 7-like [Physcomitrium patens]PNR30347.1 hypothetical protein PHYPA_026663 [Physcomitrium patens]|eukprot:XP_024360324.1 protein PLASTID TRANSCRIPTIONALLY ACTIVE 7-like [Physcomitrella patens]
MVGCGLCSRNSTMALSSSSLISSTSSQAFFSSSSCSSDALAGNSFSCSSHFNQHQVKALPRISCKAEDTIGSKRRGRRGGRKDPMLEEHERDEGTTWPYLQTNERVLKDNLNLNLLVDTENLLSRANNKFGLALEIAEEANEYLRNNKEEALYKKPILKVMSDRINEAAGENIRDSYMEERLDPQH